MSEATAAAPAAPAAAPAGAPAAPAPGAAAAPATQATDTTAATTQTTNGNEPQDAGAKPGGGEGEQGKTDASEATYEYKMPEGMQLDQAAADSLTAFAKENGITPEHAQKLADIGAQMLQRQVDKHAETVVSWVNEVKADKEIGGDKLNDSLATAKRAIDFIGDPALKQLLDTTGYGNHPVLVRAFVKLGKHISPDTLEKGHQKPNDAPSGQAARMYSASNMNP